MSPAALRCDQHAACWRDCSDFLPHYIAMAKLVVCLGKPSPVSRVSSQHFIHVRGAPLQKGCGIPSPKSLWPRRCRGLQSLPKKAQASRAGELRRGDLRLLNFRHVLLSITLKRSKQDDTQDASCSLVLTQTLLAVGAPVVPLSKKLRRHRLMRMGASELICFRSPLIN